jgi:hypothetical protein
MRSCEEATVFSCFYYKKNSAKLSSPKLRRLHCDGAASEVQCPDRPVEGIGSAFASS